MMTSNVVLGEGERMTMRVGRLVVWLRDCCCTFFFFFDIDSECFNRNRFLIMVSPFLSLLLSLHYGLVGGDGGTHQLMSQVEKRAGTKVLKLD